MHVLVITLTYAFRLRPKEYLVENERWDPVTAGASSVLGTVTDFTSALGGAFIDPFKDVKRVRPDGTRRSAGTATAVASGKALQGMTTAVVKGSLVDVPLAFAEGFRNTPRLYGEKVADYGPVTDWKSGSTVAAKVCTATLGVEMRYLRGLELWNWLLRRPN
jgi:hypothetical protein